MIIQKAFKFAYYPSRSVKTKLRSTFGTARWVYNHYLNLQINNYSDWTALPEETRGKAPHMSYIDMSRDLTQLKCTPQYSWVADTDSVILQEALKQLEVAYKSFFRTKQGFPVFKRRGNRSSVSMTYRGFGFRDNTFYINCKPLKLRGGRDVAGRPLRLTISQELTGKYYVSVISSVDIPENKTVKVETIGIDMGIKDWAIDNSGVKYKLPSTISDIKTKAIVQQRKLSKIQEALKPMRNKPITDPLRVELNRVKNLFRIRLARLHAKIVNIRRDWIHKITCKLIKGYKAITVESLDIVEMVKSCKASRTLKHNLPRLIQTAAWSEFFRQLTYKAAWSGNTTIVRSGKYFPSTQLCNMCGTQSKSKIPLQERRWWCTNCGAHHDRDINAARNLNSVGKYMLGILKNSYKPLLKLKIKDAVWI